MDSTPIGSLPPDQCILSFSVTDTGCGIAESELASIFAEFETSQSSHGSGLGLYISAAFADMLGGALHCRSTEGQDAEFKLTLPVQLVDPARVVDESTPSAASEGDGIVLVVDDNNSVATTMVRLLKHLGYESRHARTWAAAEPVLNSGVDFVLLDLRMPEITGFEFLSRIRQLNLSVQPHVVAVTGDATSTTRQQVANSDFDGFLAKPFSLAVLGETLSTLAARPVLEDASP